MLYRSLVIISLLILPVAVSAQESPVGALLGQALINSAQVKSACPALVSTAIRDPNDKATWVVNFATPPDQTCLNIVGAIITATIAPPALPTSVQITSTQFPALNGTYPIDTATLQNMQFLASYVAINGAFPAGQPAQIWLDTSLQRHSFTSTTEWLAFAKAVADFYALAQLGQKPAEPVAIP